ncbi:MAG: hypothetical protein AABW86_03350 [Candidatus Micrarchaeota archaeon]
MENEGKPIVKSARVPPLFDLWSNLSKFFELLDVSLAGELPTDFTSIFRMGGIPRPWARFLSSRRGRPSKNLIVYFQIWRIDLMVHASKEIPQKTAETRAREPRRTRVQAAWNNPGLVDTSSKQGAVLRPEDVHAIQKLREIGGLTIAVAMSKSIEDTRAASSDTEMEAVATDFSLKIRELIDYLESKHPNYGRVLMWRMEELGLDEIGEKLGGLCRERIRQIEVNAKRFLREDLELRALAEAAGIDTTAYYRNVAFLKELGFSDAFISRWEKYGFPSSDHLTIAAVFIAEAAYPHCVAVNHQDAVIEPGKDRLDEVRFAKILAKINTSKIDDLCEEFGKDMGELIDRLQKYFSKCVERAKAALSPKSIAKESENPKPEIQAGDGKPLNPPQTPGVSEQSS